MFDNRKACSKPNLPFQLPPHFFAFLCGKTPQIRDLNSLSIPAILSSSSLLNSFLSGFVPTTPLKWFAKVTNDLSNPVVNSQHLTALPATLTELITTSLTHFLHLIVVTSHSQFFYLTAKLKDPNLGPFLIYLYSLSGPKE